MYCLHLGPRRPSKCCTVFAIGPGGLQSVVLYPFWALEPSKALYCLRFGALQPFKVLYCMHFKPWRLPKCCNVYIFGPGGVQSDALYAFLALEASKVLYCRYLQYM